MQECDQETRVRLFGKLVGEIKVHLEKINNYNNQVTISQSQISNC